MRGVSGTGPELNRASELSIAKAANWARRISARRSAHNGRSAPRRSAKEEGHGDSGNQSHGKLKSNLGLLPRFGDSARSITCPARNSVRTTQAIPRFPEGKRLPVASLSKHQAQLGFRRRPRAVTRSATTLCAPASNRARREDRVHPPRTAIGSSAPVPRPRRRQTESSHR